MKNYKFKSLQFRHYTIIGWILFWGGYLAGLSILPYGVHYNDEPYQITCAFSPGDCPQGLLSAWIGSVIGKLIAWKWLGFRIFSYTALTLCMLFSVNVVCRWFGCDRSKTVLYGGFVSCLAAATSFWTRYYGWDIYTILFTTALLLVLSRYMCMPHVKWILATGIIGGLGILARLPNISLVPIVIILILWQSKCRLAVRILHALLFFLFCFCTCLAIISLFGFTPEGYISELSEGVSSEHSLTLLAVGFVKTLAKTMAFIIVLIAFGLSVYLMFKISKVQTRIAVILFLISAFIVLISWVSIKYAQNSGVSYFVVAFTIGVIIIGLADKSLPRRDKRILWTILLIGVIPACGSLLGMVKYATYPLLVIALPILGKSVCNVASKKTVLLVMTAILLSGVIYNLNRNFGDAAPPFLHEELSDPKFAGLRTSEPHKAYIEGVAESICDCKREGDGKVVVIGDGLSRYVFEYQYFSPNAYLRNNWEEKSHFDAPDYSTYVSRLIIGRDTRIILLLSFDLDSEWKDVANTEVGKTVADMLGVPLKEGLGYAVFVGD